MKQWATGNWILINTCLLLCANGPCRYASAQMEATITLEQKLSVLHFLRNTYDPYLAGKPDEAYAAAYGRLFGPVLNPTYVASLTANERKKLLETTLLTAWTFPDRRYLRDMELVADSIISRKEPTTAQMQPVYQELLSRRQFDAAARLAVRAGITDATKLQLIDGAGKNVVATTVLYLTSKPNELIRRRLDIRHGTQIIVLSTPSCPFCVRAADFLSRDSQLRGIFADYSQWIAPTNVLFDYSGLLSWEKKYPDFRTSAMYDAAEWPSVMSVVTRGTPTFFFFVDGDLQDRIDGWPSDSTGKARIMSSLRKIGAVR